MKTVFITGGLRGIGYHLAQEYAASGARVILGVRKPEDAKKLPANVEVMPLDVADDVSVHKLAERLKNVPIDILINNAGVIGPDNQTPTDMDFEGFLHTLSVNTVGPLRVTQALLPNLRLASQAQVAVISSMMGALSHSSSDHVAYRASKAAVNKVVQCMATDFKPLGIAVASLHPGWVRTDMGGTGADISPEESAKGIKAVLDKLDISKTGRFWNYDGKQLEW